MQHSRMFRNIFRHQNKPTATHQFLIIKADVWDSWKFPRFLFDDEYVAILCCAMNIVNEYKE